MIKLIRNIVGYIIMGIGLVGFVYFGYYHGDKIPLTNLWFILSLAFIYIGVFFGKIFKIKNKNGDVDEEATRIKILKERGEKIIPEINSCEFKQSNYQREAKPVNPLVIQIPDESSSEINQLVIVYKHKTSEKTETFISPIIYIDEVTLEYHIIKKDLVLYVDRSNRSNYYFNLER